METQQETTISTDQSNSTREITIQSLLESGAHFGHGTTNWNPKMAPYLYGARNEVYIFKLDLTLNAWQKAREIVVDLIARGGSLLLVGTKQQSGEIIKREAERCGIPYVDHKWVGGTLTNIDTLRNSIKTMEHYEKLVAEGESGKFTKKELLLKKKELEKLNKKFGGIRTMRRVPDMVFIVDVVHHKIAVEEARKLHIPIMAIVDSNGDPDLIDHVIPANDDATGALDLFLTNLADAVLEGRAIAELENLRLAKIPVEHIQADRGGGVENSETQKRTHPEKDKLEVVFKSG